MYSIVTLVCTNTRTVARSRRGRARKVFFSSVIRKLSSPFHENVLLVVESSLVDFSFDSRSFVRSASFPLLSTSSPSSSRGEIFVIFSHITFTHAKRYDTNTPHKFLRARVSVGLIKHQSCHQNPLARRLHLRFLKLRRRRRPMGFHRFPKTAS